MLVPDKWKDYELLDAGDGMKLERWGRYVLSRPDPQAIWPATLDPSRWKKADAYYIRSSSGGGHWEYNRDLPERWIIAYGPLSFYVWLSDFKHTGLFPEQAVNWDWIIDRLSRFKQKYGRPASVLNLFAYTGAATMAALHAGAEVCHVDASKGMVAKARENIVLSGLSGRTVRFIVDDVMKYVQREIRRGRKYDAIIMDPPSYGRGPCGEMWKIEEGLYALIGSCIGVMSDTPAFFILNSYTTGLSAVVLENLVKMTIAAKYNGKASCSEMGIAFSGSELILPCGVCARWEP